MAGTMKAMQMVAIGEPLQLREVPIPEVGDEDVLVAIARCGFNGGDPHLISADVRVSRDYMPGIKLPMTFGHDGCGVVAAVGPAARGVQVGDRVYVWNSAGCGRCLYCRTDRHHICPERDIRGWLTYNPNPQFARYKDGVAAQYALAHYTHLAKLPPGLSFDVASHLGILTVAYRAAKRGSLAHGEVVIITGATGCTGAVAVLAARLFNPAKIIAVARERGKLERLRSIDPRLIDTISTTEEDLTQRLQEITDGQGADLLLDFIPRGVRTTEDAIARLKPGGRVVLVGGCTEELRISYRYIMTRSIVITGSRAGDPTDTAALFGFILGGTLDLSPIAIHNFPLEEANEAMQMLVDRPGEQPFWVSVVPSPGLD